MQVRITPALGYAHGHIETLLIQLGISPPARRPDGIVEMELSEQQIGSFQLKGNAHRLERLAEGSTPSTPAAVAAAPIAPASVPAAPPPEPPSTSTLNCPICGAEFILVHALAPGKKFAMPCNHCSATLEVEKTSDVYTVTNASPKEADKNAQK